jgi:hypothetical protein
MTIKNLIRSWLGMNDTRVMPNDAPVSPHMQAAIMATRTFVLHEAMNGTYIVFTRHRYNPTGPDLYEQTVYIVQPGESLIDAISTVLVLASNGATP